MALRQDLGDRRISVPVNEYSEKNVTRLVAKVGTLVCPGIPFRFSVFVLLSSFFCLAVLAATGEYLFGGAGHIKMVVLCPGNQQRTAG